MDGRIDRGLSDLATMQNKRTAQHRAEQSRAEQAIERNTEAAAKRHGRAEEGSKEEARPGASQARSDFPPGLQSSTVPTTSVSDEMVDTYMQSHSQIGWCYFAFFTNLEVVVLFFSFFVFCFFSLKVGSSG